MWMCDYKYNDENTVNYVVMNKVRPVCTTLFMWAVGKHLLKWLPEIYDQDMRIMYRLEYGCNSVSQLSQWFGMF